MLIVEKMTAFWDTAPYSLVEVGRRFRGTYYLHHQGYDYQSTLRNIPEGCHLHTRGRENLKFQMLKSLYKESVTQLNNFQVFRKDSVLLDLLFISCTEYHKSFP
jgi:hypothetical protein